MSKRKLAAPFHESRATRPRGPSLQTSFDKTYAPRTRARLRSAFLTSAHVRDVETVYRAGFSLAYIAGIIWKRWGYKNAESCEQAIRQALRRDGVRLRPPRGHKEPVG